MTKSKIRYTVFKILFFFALMGFMPTIICAASFLSYEHKTISYTDIGQGEPLVLIHAFPTDQRLWQPQQEGLKPYFRIITIDLWGFGQSATVDGLSVTMADYANEVKQLLEQLGIKKAIIGGESMGGYVALAFLEKYPDSLIGLILSDTQSIADSDEARTKRETTAVNVLQHGTGQLINGFIPKALTANAPEHMRVFLQSILVSQSAEAVASALRGMALRVDLSHLLSNTLLPVLIITGEQDVLISSQQSQDMHQLAKNSRLVIIKEAAHLSSLEQSLQWNRAVREMFSRSTVNQEG